MIENANVYVLSASRYDNLPFTQKEKNYFIFCVKNGQADLYRKAGCKNVVETGNLVASKNWALEHAFAERKICVQLADDVKKITTNPNFGPKEQITLTEAISIMVTKLEATKGLYLLGIPPTPNAFYAKSIISKNTFCIGDALFIKPSIPRFDPNMTLKEDYDFTLAHIAQYGITARYQKLLWEFSHYTNQGGAVSYRTTQEEQKNISYLLRKWPNNIRLNPKRENEILMKA